MTGFYKEVIDRLIAHGVLNHRMKILVVCAGRVDKDVLHECGFRDVVVSNLDDRARGHEFAPFQWSRQDAERLTFEDRSFDFAIVHSGLHHCRSPHRALLEMYRVSKKGLLLFEPYDNLTTRLGVRLNIGQEYEHAAVFYNDCSHGGVTNSPVPNYVYRWTQREIVKTIAASAPHVRHAFKFFHQLRIPWTQLKGRKKRIFLFAAVFALPVLRLLAFLSPKQCNNFAAVVLKPEVPQDLQPWLLTGADGLGLNRSWLEKRYGRGR